MKIFIISIIVLIASAQASAQAVPSVDPQQLFDEIVSQINEAANQVASAVQSAVNVVGVSILKNAGSVVAALRALGAESFALRVEVEFSGAFGILKNQVEEKLAQAESTFNNFRRQLIRRVQGDINVLNLVIARNNSAAQCWTNNSAAVQSVANQIAQQIRSTIISDLISLKNEASSIAAQINQTVAADLTALSNACGRNETCVRKYVIK